MKRFGLIGHPIAHSLSPALFKAAYALPGDKEADATEYIYELIESEDFNEAYRRFIDGYDGVNVTAPFKELAFAKADMLSPECRLIGATNLLVKTSSGIKAYNSDYYGIALAILAYAGGQHFPPRPSQNEMRKAMSGKAETALVAGAGGAGKAAAIAAAGLGLKTTLMNRTIEKAERIASELPEFGFNVRPISEFAEAFKDSDIIIYTLPKAIDGITEIASGICGRNVGEKYILEANYRDPALKDIAGSLKSLGITYIPGEEWLLYQAYAGYDLFTGKTPSLPDMASAISARNK